jgi:hypothetical protein
MSPRYQSDIDLCSLCAEVVLSYFVQVQKWLLLIISLRHRSGINLSRSGNRSGINLSRLVIDAAWIFCLGVIECASVV